MGENGKQRKKLSKAQLRTIIVAAISAVVAIALIVINFFVPVKYLFSYVVLRNGGAEDGVMRVRFVDVGYGESIIVELPDGKNMLIDAGNGRASNQSQILKYLNKCDVDEIDYLVCTSVNGEHCGGLYEILQYKKVNTIFMPYCANGYVTDEYHNFLTALKACNAETIISEYGLGAGNPEYGYFFRFLSPSPYNNPDGEYAALEAGSTSFTARNNASAVIWLEYAGTCILLTSDAGTDVLNNICNSYAVSGPEYPVKLENCTVVSVANHGSDSSLCPLFYEMINPEAAVISVGENGAGCPSPQALSDLMNTKIYRTDEHGAVTVEVTREGYEII